MPAAEKQLYMTMKEYLAFEEESQIKHEFVDGCVFAMTGGTRTHHTIAANIYSSLRAHLKGSGCRAYVGGVKVHVKAASSIYYPDVVMDCGAIESEILIENPLLIVEVLSRSTAAIDRREKMRAYKQIPSLIEYLIVHQRKKKVELHRKGSDDQWTIHEFGPGSELVLEAIPYQPLTLSMNAIYEDIEFKNSSHLSVREGEYDPYSEESELDW